MQQTIEEIRILLKDGAFKDEQHVRFSLVGKFCRAFGVNTWDPSELVLGYPEFHNPPQFTIPDLQLYYWNISAPFCKTYKITTIATLHQQTEES
jgi:hypothetical protein